MSRADALPSRPPSGETEAVSRAKATPTEKAASTTKARWLALDLLRFTAVVLMVQGHVFYEVIDDTVRRASWYSWHGFVHGFTAPIFLFSSGMAFGVTTLGKWGEHTHFGRAVLKRFERYAILLGIGYLLQVGDLGLRYMMGLPVEALHRATAVNALQLIGVVLAFAEAMVLLLRRPPLFLALMGFAMFGAVLAAPWTWDLTLEGWPVPVAAYVTSTTRSLFPIFPWAGFLLGGILVARFVRGRRKTAKPGVWQLVIPLALVSATLVLLGKSAPFVGDPFPDHNVWKAGPFFFVFRLGVVLGLLAVLCAIDLGISRLTTSSADFASRPAGRRAANAVSEGSREGAPRGFTPRGGGSGDRPSRQWSSRAITLLQTLGAETLVVYVAHLLMIYGVFGLPGLKDRFPKNLGLAESIVLVVAVFGTMVAFAWLWHETKKRHPKAFDRVRYALMALVVIVFFAR
jgi:uncharacterized membrane protein